MKDSYNVFQSAKFNSQIMHQMDQQIMAILVQPCWVLSFLLFVL